MCGCISMTKSAEEWNKEAIQLYKEGKFQDAIRVFGYAISNDPNNIVALVGMGDAYKAQEWYGEALTEYAKVLSISPQNFEALMGKADIMTKLERYSEAVAVYDQILKTYPNNANAWYEKGNVYLYMGNAIQNLPETEMEPKMNMAEVIRREKTGDCWLSQKTKKAISLFNQAKEAYTTALFYEPSHKNARDSLSSIPKYECGYSLLPSAMYEIFSEERDACNINCEIAFSDCTVFCVSDDGSCHERCYNEQNKCKISCSNIGSLRKN